MRKKTKRGPFYETPCIKPITTSRKFIVPQGGLLCCGSFFRRVLGLKCLEKTPAKELTKANG